MQDIHGSIEEMIPEMICFLQKWGLWRCVNIFACGNVYSCVNFFPHGEEFRGWGLSNVKIQRNIDPNEYVSFPDGEKDGLEHIFDMTFEGPLYGLLNRSELYAEFGTIEEDAWDYILEHSKELLQNNLYILLVFLPDRAVQKSVT